MANSNDIVTTSGEIITTISGTVPKLISTTNKRMSGSIFSDKQINLRTLDLKNYQNAYEYISVPGRRENNLYATYNPIGESNPQNPLLQGEVISTLPARTPNQSVFAVKFSAPGGREAQGRGYLDRESEELSVYNSMNYRNFQVRSASMKEEIQYTEVSPSPALLESSVYYRLGTGSVRGINEGLFIATGSVPLIPTQSAMFFWFRVTNDKNGAIVKEPNDLSTNTLYVSGNNGTTYNVVWNYSYLNGYQQLVPNLKTNKWYPVIMGHGFIGSLDFHVRIEPYGLSYSGHPLSRLSGFPQFGVGFDPAWMSANAMSGAAIDIRAPVYLGHFFDINEINSYIKAGPLHDPRKSFENWTANDVLLCWVDPLTGTMTGTNVANVGSAGQNPLFILSQSVDSPTFPYTMPAGVPTIHGAEKNTRYKLKKVPVELNYVDQVITSSIHDNGLIKYHIPYHIDQIQWVYRTFIKNTTTAAQKFMTEDVMTGSGYYQTESVTNSGSHLSAFTNDYSPAYGFPSWQQIRAGESWKNRVLKNKNYIIRWRKDVNVDGTVISQPFNLISSGALDTGSEGTYIFKESPVDYTNESVEYEFDNEIIISQPIYNDMFSNLEINNFIGLTKNVQYPLDTSKYKIRRLKKQLFPDPKYAGQKRFRHRENFAFKSWRDDYHFSDSNGWQFNKSNSRIASVGTAGETIPELRQRHFTGSIWPLDFYFNKNEGGRYVVGELMSNVVLPIAPFRTSVANACYTYSELSAQTMSLPWTLEPLNGLKPFLDSNELYSEPVFGKYVNYSLVPEFNISSNIDADNFHDIDKRIDDIGLQFSITGSTTNVQFTSDVVVNKTLVFNIDSVLQFRPYNHFYPAHFTLKCSKQFSQSLNKIPDFHITESASGRNKINIASAPWFRPGVLYDSIKAGIPMGNNLLTGALEYPFESIFDPIPHILNRKVEDQFYFTASVNTDSYKGMISNFLNEVRYTFCKNNTLSYFESFDEQQFQIFKSGTVYSMDLQLTVGETRKIVPPTAISYYRSGSLTWADGVNYIGQGSFENFPCYYQNELDPASVLKNNSGLSTVRISFTPPLTRKYSIDEIFAISNTELRFSPIGAKDPLSTPNSSRVDNSFNLFEKTVNCLTNITTWQINSKWEFPFLALTGTIFTYSNGLEGSRSVDGEATPQGSYVAGLWHDYCEIPNEKQGLFLKLSDVKYNHSGTSGATYQFDSASLAKMVGFERKQKRVGELATNKQISELLCIVPVFRKNNSLVSINSTFPLHINNQILAKKYFLPPKLGHNNINDNENSILFFTQKITDTWSKKDLSLIWQNVLPQNGLSFKEDKKILSITDQKVLKLLENETIYFLVFKCKERSISNPWPIYGHNWPYDEFSLLELCKIDVITEKVV